MTKAKQSARDEAIATLEQWRATGRIAFYHPRSQTISLNGGKHVPIKEALKKIQEILNAQPGGTQTVAMPSGRGGCK